MENDWISNRDGLKLKYKRETLLNYVMNRWGLNQAYSVGSTSELIRACAPSNFEEWDEFYFANAEQKKKNGIKISREYITELGQKLYIKLSEVVQNELASITEDECIDYAYDLILRRTYEGYVTEIETVYGLLESMIQMKIEAAPDEWDRTYGVDFFIKVFDKYIGIQIKPISSGKALNDYQWIEMHRKKHEKFERDFGGKVFFIYSEKVGTSKRKKISNIEVVEEIKAEIKRLSH